jgi:hypothetical protein
MRALMGIVIGLGIMIIMVIVMIGYGFYKKTVDPDWRLLGEETSKSTTSTPQTNNVGFGDINLGLPAGCRVMNVTAEGALAYLKIGPDSTCESVIVVDVSKGQILGRIAPR